jgi:WD40 repeat protein
VSSERQSLDTWNTRSGELASVIQLAPTSPPQRLFKDLAISGDGRFLAAVETVSLPDRDTNSVICIYDRASGREMQKIDAGTLFGGLDFSPDGSRLAGVMRDGTALIWDLSPAQRLPHK